MQSQPTLALLREHSVHQLQDSSTSLAQAISRRAADGFAVGAGGLRQAVLLGLQLRLQQQKGSGSAEGGAKHRDADGAAAGEANSNFKMQHTDDGRAAEAIVSTSHTHSNLNTLTQASQASLFSH